MGSLMAGWTSESGGHKGLGRKGSFTRDEIDDFWRMRKAELQEHEEHVASRMESVQETEAPTGAAPSQSSQDGTSNPFSADDPESLTEEEKRTRVKDWWTKSNWAFLNSPPEVEKSELKGGTYVSQYDVAEKAMVGDAFGMTAN